MATTDGEFAPFGLAEEAFAQIPPDRNGIRIINLRGRRGGDHDTAGKWLRNAMVALAVLAAAAAAVSYQAQYVLIQAVKHAAAMAYLQAGIPDVGAAVFACLGIAVALQGRHGIRARALNLVCVGTSVTMNALAAHGGWRPLAVWVMAPVLYALASDTLIGVIRSWTIARQRGHGETLADDEAGPLAVAAGLLLWLLRLALAPRTTLTGFRRWVVEECPVAPGRRVCGDTAELPAEEPKRVNAAPAARPHAIPAPQGETKTARFLIMVEQRHGPLADIPLDQTSRLAGEVAPLVDLHPGSARRELRAAVQAARAERSAS